MGAEEMTTKAAGARLLVCNCERTMDLDGKALAKGLGSDEPMAIHTQLCRAEIETFEGEAGKDSPLLVACTQEAPLFAEIAEERGLSDIRYVNIRERAGWCQDKSKVAPKIAALLAEARHVPAPAGAIPLISDGVCLVYGAGQGALEVAEQLSGRLSVSLLLTDSSDILPPSVMNVPIYQGRISSASGHLGAFDILVDGYAPTLPSSKSELEFQMARDGAKSSCDLIFDMSGGTPLFPEHDRRDGYLHVDPDHPAAVAKAMFEISDMVGEFEKPLYVQYDADICAHSRSQKVGCSNCLDNCPLSAISPDGDNVSVDHAVCGGCGNCSAVCPTGAVSYDYPGRADVIKRCQVLADTYLGAGGADPVLLVHDDSHGSGLIGAMARYGRGLPVNVLPLSLYTVTQLGHEAMAAALAAGFQQIIVLASPEHRDELSGLEAQAALTNSLMSGLGYGAGPRVHIVVEADPDAVEEHLYGLARLSNPTPVSFAARGGKREIARTALMALNENGPGPQEIVPLTDGAPYGRIHIDVEGCTLCLACVGACPANALADSPDRPMVRFTEAACVQCGLCKATCPEKVISLEPRYDFTATAQRPQTLNEETPFECVSCGKPFGSRAAIERVVAQLAGKHWMFQDAERTQVLQMCEDCRIEAVANLGDDPFAMGERPKVRTTDDYVRAEELAEKTGRTPDDFLN